MSTQRWSSSSTPFAAAPKIDNAMASRWSPKVLQAANCVGRRPRGRRKISSLSKKKKAPARGDFFLREQVEEIRKGNVHAAVVVELHALRGGSED